MTPIDTAIPKTDSAGLFAPEGGGLADPQNSRRGRLVTPAVASVFAAWAAAIVVLGARGFFALEVGGAPVAIIAAVALPLAVFGFAYRVSRRVRAWVVAQDLALLTALQGWRVLGGAFVFLWLFGHLPPVFAVPAGFGDVAVGLMAPFAAIAIARQAAGWRGAAWAVVVAGLADFAVAFATGAASISGNLLHLPGAVGNDPINRLPLVIVPGFFVPAFAILHVMAILRLRAGG